MKYTGYLLLLACSLVYASSSIVNGVLTSINYVSFEYADKYPDAIFFSLNDGKHYRMNFKGYLPVKEGMIIEIEVPEQRVYATQPLSVCAMKAKGSLFYKTYYKKDPRCGLLK